MNENYKEVETIHLPELVKFVLTIAHENEDNGCESFGSGVKIRYGSHHLIATAAHCMRRNPRVIRDEHFYLSKAGKIVTQPPVRILGGWTHDRLDIGFLEVGEALGAELGDTQLCTGRVVNGHLFVIGNPVCEIQTFETIKEKTLVRTAFGSTVRAQADDYIRLNYPVTGSKYACGTWVEAPFIDRPHGFSGGGCFAVPAGERDGLRVIAYKLLGIQCSWLPSERWVEIVPIQHLLDGLNERFG